MNVSDLTGPDLDPYIAKALGHLGEPTGIIYHESKTLAMQLFMLHGLSIQRFNDGFHATMHYGGKVHTRMDKDKPELAIFRAYIVAKLGDIDKDRK